MDSKETLTYKQQLRAINEAVYDIQLTMNERKFYNWISTQYRHKHVLFFTPNWREKWLRIDQKRKR